MSNNPSPTRRNEIRELLFVVLLLGLLLAL